MSSDSNNAKTNSISGRSAFLALLRDEGVRTLFGNPGTTELPIMHALTEQEDISYVMGLQESIVVAMADGYARASGELAACNVHVAPGLGNAIGALYTAYITGSPVLITAGQQEQGHGLTEPLLYAPLVPIAQPVVKWAVEVNRIEDLPRIVHRAAKVALTPPTGPVFISLPGDILNMEAPLDLGLATRVDTSTRPTASAIAALASRILEAKAPVIIAGHEIVASDAIDEAGQLADVLGAPVYQQTVQDGAHFRSEHPAFMGGLTRSQPLVREALKDYDLLICVGSDVLRMSVYSEVDPLPPMTDVVQIGLRDWELGKNYPAVVAMKADVKETLRDLVPALAASGGEALKHRATEKMTQLAARNWTAQRAKLVQSAAKSRDAEPMAPDWLMMSLVENLPDGAIVVDEGVTTAQSLLSLLPIREQYDYFGNVSGGIGWGIAAAVGVQVAQPTRRVVAVIGDGSAMYSVQALWSAAKQKLPMIFVIANNGGYRIIKQRLKSFHGNEQFIGMDFEDPPIDSAGLARSFGMKALVATNAAEFEAAMAQAVAGEEPVLIDAKVQGHV
ncbi:MAG: thiamine pyrophosphate-binding protein [Gammaproteobacteria bacterium]|nr:thiamine pyrophosphate-binding protein [Gammaproteobacteria bacterium]